MCDIKPIDAIKIPILNENQKTIKIYWYNTCGLTSHRILCLKFKTLNLVSYRYRIKLRYMIMQHQIRFPLKVSLREKCPNTGFFLVRIFLYSVQIQENTDQKELRIWKLFTQCFLSTCNIILSFLWTGSRLLKKSLTHLFPVYPFSTPWEHNRKVFWCFQGLQKACIRNKWINRKLFV